MKRSKQIELTVIGATVTLLASCAGSTPANQPAKNYQQCVDQNKVVVSDQMCNQPVRAGGSGIMPYLWMYSMRPYSPGMTITDGFTSPRANLGAPVRSSGVPVTGSSVGSAARSGGFGSTGAGASVGA